MTFKQDEPIILAMRFRSGAWVLLRLLIVTGAIIVLSGCSQPAATPLPAPTPTVQVTATPQPAVPTPAVITLGEVGMTTYQTMTLRSGTILEYAIVLPEDFDEAKVYPILLALPPGPQTKDMVQWGLRSYWAETAHQRGWIVLSPVAPDGVLFFQGAEGVLPEFLAWTATLLKPEGGKYHLAGISNGGISAFRIALNRPELFHDLLVLPGFPQNDQDFQRLNTLTTLPVMMFVGENDDGWVQRMEATEAALNSLGGQVELEIVRGEGHVIQSLGGGERLFDFLEENR